MCVQYIGYSYSIIYTLLFKFAVSPIHSELNVNDSSCIKIAIDNMCLECAYSFYANVTIRNGTCDDTNALVTTELVQFNNDYTVRVPILEVVETSACYNASIYHKSEFGKEHRVGTVSQRNINLQSCDMSFNGGNKAVLHNSVTTDEVATRCVNGTFVPFVRAYSSSDSGKSMLLIFNSSQLDYSCRFWYFCFDNGSHSMGFKCVYTGNSSCYICCSCSFYLQIQ